MALIVRPGDTVVLAADKAVSQDVMQAMVEHFKTLEMERVSVTIVPGLFDSFIYRSDET